MTEDELLDLVTDVFCGCEDYLRKPLEQQTTAGYCFATIVKSHCEIFLNESAPIISEPSLPGANEDFHEAESSDEHFDHDCLSRAADMKETQDNVRGSY
jgi:hypothetical protein